MPDSQFARELRLAESKAKYRRHEETLNRRIRTTLHDKSPKARQTLNQMHERLHEQEKIAKKKIESQTMPAMIKCIRAIKKKLFHGLSQQHRLRQRHKQSQLKMSNDQVWTNPDPLVSVEESFVRQVIDNLAKQLK